MKRIDTETAYEGRFVDGNRLSGRKATRFNATWCNQVQEELCNLIKALTGQEPTGTAENEAGTALDSLLFSGNGEIKEHKITVGSSVWENLNQYGPKISGLHFMQSSDAEFQTIQVKGSGSGYGEIGYGSYGAFINSFYSVSAGVAEFVSLTTTQDASVGGDLGVTGDASVGGDLGVTGDLSVTGDATVTGSVTADGGFGTANGDIATTNGTVSGSTVEATSKLTIGSALRFVIDGTTGHTVSDAESWLANTAPQNSICCVVNDNTAGVTLWSGDSRQVELIGKTAMLCIKIGTTVYPMMPTPNY